MLLFLYNSFEFFKGKLFTLVLGRDVKATEITKNFCTNCTTITRNKRRRRRRNIMTIIRAKIQRKQL